MKRFLTFFLMVLMSTTGGFNMKVLAGEARKTPNGLNAGEWAYLDGVEKATFKGFEQLIDPATQFPVDIASVATGKVVIDYKNKYFNKTSPTNIGLGFLYLVLAKERSVISGKEAYDRALQMMNSLEKLETCKGFLFNWYYLNGNKEETPRISQDRFVSSLDNGDMDISLMAAAGAFPDTELSKRITAYLDRKDYHFFFDKNPSNGSSGMINVGYDDARKRYHAADYSIFNIEGRMTILVGIIKDGIPESAWKNMSRLVKTYQSSDGNKISVVAPWGGSLYETLFADEIIGGFKIAPEAFETNAIRMIKIHQDFGSKVSESGIWGFSNGEVPAENKYEMVGVPEIAYNRFPGEFVTVYSSFLSLRYAPHEVIKNLRNMEALNPKIFSAQYGFTDSIDPKTGKINLNILSLDKGMEVLSIGNFLSESHGNKGIPEYLWAYFVSRGWDEKATTLLKAEEDNPFFRSLTERPVVPMSPGTKSITPIDLIEVSQEIGTFYEPDRAKASYQLLITKGKQIIKVYYDVKQRYSFSGFYVKLDNLDISPFTTLSLKLRGDKENGFPKSVKVELKFKGKYIAFEHISISEEWGQKKILLPPGGKMIDEIAIVFENATSVNHPTGIVDLQSLFLETDNSKTPQ